MPRKKPCKPKGQSLLETLLCLPLAIFIIGVGLWISALSGLHLHLKNVVYEAAVCALVQASEKQSTNPCKRDLQRQLDLLPVQVTNLGFLALPGNRHHVFLEVELFQQTFRFNESLSPRDLHKVLPWSL